ncbi:U11/U12 small nuclear ribonucleoprotein 31 kDa protein [Spatholobus suberectus]|nr:U11/U12 small nuclear ribonucleoprotein 31 kDa protein [Spatholobus suberectus]
MNARLIRGWYLSYPNEFLQFLCLRALAKKKKTYSTFAIVVRTQINSKPNTTNKGFSSSSLAPSKSTLYVSNLDYFPTNFDLHTLFSTFSHTARIDVIKDRLTRLSCDITFIQFVSLHNAHTATAQMHYKVPSSPTTVVPPSSFASVSTMTLA